MRHAVKLAILCILALAGEAFSDQIAVNQFKGLNNNESSVIIDPAYAQDLLNVEITPGGKSVKKRAGYGLYQTLYASQLQGVHGGYHFFDSSGNDVQLWASSTSVYGIVADATPTQIVSSTTLNATLDCADTQGSAYCVTSSRDFFIKTNGATLTSWSTSPLGTMVEATPDRVAVAGLVATPNTISISGSNAFTTFTVGPLTTDPFTEPIAAPGSKLTHLRWACGKLLWWKDQSFGWFAFEDQYAAQIKIVSDNIGTLDNTSAIDPGGSVWFRGQDGHIWQYDCSGLIKQSIEIAPLVQASGRRTANSWTQTSQSDWQSGSILPTGQLSTTISAGDVVPSSFTVTENSSSSGWSSGSNSNFAVGTSSLSLALNNSGNITDNGFETNPITTNWTTSITGSDNIASFANIAGKNCANITPDSGSRFALILNAGGTSNLTVQLVDVSNSTVFVTKTVTFATNSCTWASQTISSSGITGKRFRLKFSNSNGSYGITKDSYILGGDITFKTTSDAAVTVPNTFFDIDTILLGSNTVTSGSFTSQIFNTGLTSATYSLTNFAYTVDTSTPSFALLTSTANPSNSWVSLLTTSGTNAVGNQYVRYVTTITVTPIDNAATSITNSTILARSSGTFYSAWKNAPSFRAWSTFNPVKSDGDGSHTFYVRASTSPQSVLNSTVTWVSQPADSLVATSTVGVYFQFRDDFTIGAATNTPALNSSVVNWFEGNATDQSYMLYFDNAIWASVAYGVGISTNNYIFRRDLINDGWVVYGFGAGGMLVQNAHLFFGGVPATAQVFQFGSGNSDNGTTMPAYWKSKDFTSPDPFLQTSLMQIDTFAKKDQGTTLTTAYTLDTSTTSTSYSILLSSTTQSVVQNRKQLPAGKNGYTFNIKYSDTSASSAWELLGYRIGFTVNPYRPSQ